MFESAIPKILQLFVSSSLLVFPSPSALPKIKKKKIERENLLHYTQF